MMKNLIKKTNNFNNLEANTIFLKDRRGYFTTNNEIVPFSKIKIRCDGKVNSVKLFPQDEDNKYVMKNSLNEPIYTLKAIWCHDIGFYIQRTIENDTNVVYIDKTNNRSLFGNANLPIKNFVYKEVFIDKSSGKITESTLIFQKNRDYVTINHIIKKN